MFVGNSFCQHLSAKTLTFSELPTMYRQYFAFAHFVFDGLRLQKLAFRLDERQENENNEALETDKLP